MPSALSVTALRKSFGDVHAVAGLDLDVPEGTCVGLLGPNGAGKSTTMRILTGQTRADAGTITALGWKLPEESKQARAQMGVVPQLDNLDTTLSARDNLRIFARLYRVPAGERDAAVARGLQIARLTERADALTGALSGGMRRRLLIARALLHRPRLLLLDEPTVGLDPQVRQELWAMIDGLRTEGTSILMTTHYIEEAERLADSVTIVAAGAAVDAGPPSELVARHAGAEVREVYGPPARLAEIESDAHAAGFATRRTGTSVAILGAEGAGDRLPAGETRASRLEDVFVKLTGEEVS
ncbi:Linearmycin resistance ATP-binding protein LnrL [Paraconexibacter sp. AEG42_29]|uniref:Linearmycin resistance ATP-binding protein LnrL n=1 Tax=Paraconexibacter sp. AEG42_29 TaxID=2997339 RepID=A0AAU7AQT7_9ACTN